MISASALAEEQVEDIADEDVWEDDLVLSAQVEINRRKNILGADYPFRIDDRGRAMEHVEPSSEAGWVYLFCLFISHAFDRTVVPKSRAPKLTNTVRDLFQACATVAAGGYVSGPARSFGFPRPDGASFLKALHEVYRLFGDGTPRRKPRAAASKNVKDNGIDIIAWRRSVDNLPGTFYLVGQVASGSDWVDKSVVSDRKHFHNYWFTEQPGSQPHDAMFIPFGLEPEDPQDGTPYEDVLKDYVQSVCYKFGDLIYRDRIARHVADGLQLVAGGEQAIQRVDDLRQVVKWVKRYAATLQTA